MRVNRWLDFADRVGWTLVQSAAAAAVTALMSDNISWAAAAKFVAIAAAIAVCKVVAAQNTGSDDLGAAVPGQVLTTEK